LAAALASQLAWRTTYLVLAVITIPAHALALRAPWPPVPPVPAHTHDALHAIIRSWPFLLLALGFTLSAFAMYVAVVTLVPSSPAAVTPPARPPGSWAWVAPARPSVASSTPPLARHTTPTARAVTLLTLGAVTTALFALVPGPYPVLIAVSVAAGAVRGNLTLLQATAVTDRWGTTYYGSLSGIHGAPAMTAPALAPFASALLASLLGGTPHLFALLAALTLAAMFVATGTSSRNPA
ncbi:MFS transporter, partial [[Kitasatospora] papulosa]